MGPVRLYAHEETDEEPEVYAEGVDLAGLPTEMIIELAGINPLYEICFEIYINVKTKRYYLTKVYSTQVEDEDPLQRPVPTDDNAGLPFGDDEWPT